MKNPRGSKKCQTRAPIIVLLAEAECVIQVVSVGIKKTNTQIEPLKKINWKVEKQLLRAGKHDMSSVILITELITAIIRTVCTHKKEVLVADSIYSNHWLGSPKYCTGV